MRKNKLGTYIIGFDKIILLSYVLLALIGLIVMVDITSVQSSMTYFYRHLLFLLVSGLSAVLILYFFNFEKLRFANTWLVYIAITMLLLVLVMGTTVKGGTRQISLGFISFQPSFFARIALVFLFANVLDKKNDLLLQATPKTFFSSFPELIILTGIVFGLIIAERHLSTLIIGGMTLFGMLAYAGIKKRILLLVLVIGLLGGIAILKFGAEFRMERIHTYKRYSLFFKERDLSQSGDGDYQVRESLTALTSGGLIGTGIARGRAKHYYLPEARTDYIYTIIGEEAGFLGAIVVFGLHCLLFFRALKVCNANDNRYLRFLGVGIAMNVFCNVLVNTGVAMSILPPTGNTLPFISYGGTALLMDSASVGIILNISAQRRQL
ncbi:MAG TPA: FtsW/RodA/SpoVE family cell cycle protein [Candidatus Cloacimonadota bacterium]|nr:FtsW/RodA/SpoVE family cell cycle protein [Candidatus Cloacimonadota bacterium]